MLSLSKVPVLILLVGYYFEVTADKFSMLWGKGMYVAAVSESWPLVLAIVAGLAFYKVTSFFGEDPEK